MSPIQDRFFKKKKKKEVKRSPILFEDSQEIISKLEKFYNGDCISYWVSQRTIISQDHINILYRLLKGRVRSDHLYIFMKSNGGSGLTSLRAIHLFRELYKKVTVLIPLECASAATMLALGADRLKIGPLGFLTAIDTFTWHELGPNDVDDHTTAINHDELERAVKLWDANKEKKDGNAYSKLYKYIHPLAIGAVDRANSLSVKLATEILSYHFKDEAKAKAISEHLNSRYPDHGYPITCREAQKIGLPAEALEWESNDLLLELNDRYSEMAKVAKTDYSTVKFHYNEITEILEINGEQIFYQKDFEYRYSKELRVWKSFEDDSGWKSVKMEDGEQQINRIFIN